MKQATKFENNKIIANFKNILNMRFVNRRVTRDKSVETKIRKVYGIVIFSCGIHQGCHRYSPKNISELLGLLVISGASMQMTRRESFTKLNDLSN